MAGSLVGDDGQEAAGEAVIAAGVSAGCGALVTRRTSAAEAALFSKIYYGTTKVVRFPSTISAAVCRLGTRKPPVGASSRGGSKADVI